MCKTVESPAVVLPTAIAVTAADCELNYAELDRWSNRLARMLLRLGAHPGARIAIAETPSSKPSCPAWPLPRPARRRCR